VKLPILPAALIAGGGLDRSSMTTVARPIYTTPRRPSTQVVAELPAEVQELARSGEGSCGHGVGVTCTR
jgi:hypothetical protein